MTDFGNAIDMLLADGKTNTMRKCQPNVEKCTGSFTTVRALTIDTLVKEYPVLRQVLFVKIDTEGYEGVIVPAMENFLREHRPVVLVSLHPLCFQHNEQYDG